MSRALPLTAAGVAVVGSTFGMARYGYGLLLPDIRTAYGLGAGAVGALAAGAYGAYLMASAASAVLAAHVGPRRLVIAGGAAATGGMLLAGLAGGPRVLAAGILLGGASAGLAYPPFGDAIRGSVPGHLQDRVLATVSSATGIGVALSAPIAIAAGADWRLAWRLFAVVAAVATVGAALVVPGRPTAGAAAPIRLRWSWLVCPRSGPLLVSGFLVGLGASVYWTFGVDFVVQDGGLGAGASRGLLVVVGAASVLGSGTSDLVTRVGARTAFTGLALLLAGSLALVAAAPGSVPVAYGSGAAFGAAYAAMVAVQCIWGGEVFASRPSAGLGALMFVLGAGLLAGPLVAGLLVGSGSLAPAFVVAAALLAATTALAPREDIARQGPAT